VPFNFLIVFCFFFLNLSSSFFNLMFLFLDGELHKFFHMLNMYQSLLFDCSKPLTSLSIFFNPN
jgi:hypothetical protein